MVSREKHNMRYGGDDDGRLHEKLQLLRSATRSRAIDDASIVLDASNYIKHLKHKVEILTQQVGTSTTTSATSPHHATCSPITVRVERVEKGFLVDVNSGRGCPGLLIPVLATLDQLGLQVLEARVSCAHAFHLQALGGDDAKKEEEEEQEEGGNYVNAQTVKRAICNTIKIWSDSI